MSQNNRQRKDRFKERKQFKPDIAQTNTFVPYYKSLKAR